MTESQFRLSPRRRRYLQAMDIAVLPITRTQAKKPAALSGSPEVVADEVSVESDKASAALAEVPGIAAVSALGWGELQSQVSVCTACDLHKGRTQTVFGVGNHQAKLLVIGEAPGATEDRLGEPFVGRAGKLLDAMLAAINLQRNQVFIANIVKCRPPNNRDPSAQEAAACRGYLERQMALIEPQVILAVGRIAAHNLLETDQAIGKLRCRVHTIGKQQIPMVVTYHPAYLLRSPKEKAKAWQDLKQVSQLMRQ